MLSKIEKRLVKTPTSILSKKRAYTKRQLEKKITKTAEDIGLLIDSKYDISEIIGSIIQHSDIRAKHMMEQILKAQKILDELEGITEPTSQKASNSDSKKTDGDNDWDM